MPEWNAAMKTDDDVIRALRAIKNKFWVSPSTVEECVKRGLARSKFGTPELTNEGVTMLRGSENTEP